MALGLAIHTASPDLGLAIATDQARSRPLLRQQVWPLDRALSNQLHLLLMEFLAPHAWTDLTYLAVAIGPGGFTGTRIGVVTARTLAQQLEIPLYGISTLAAIAMQHAQAGSIRTGLIAVSMPAQRDELFGGMYHVQADLDEPKIIEHSPTAVYTAAAWQECLAAHPVEQHQALAKGQGLGDSTIAVLTLAQQQWQQGLRPDWSTVVPFYGQHPVTL